MSTFCLTGGSSAIWQSLKKIAGPRHSSSGPGGPPSWSNGGMHVAQPGVGKTPPVWVPWPFGLMMLFTEEFIAFGPYGFVSAALA